MINFGTFPFDGEAKELIEESINNYWRFARIEITGAPGFNKDTEYALLVNVAQKELVNDKILTEKELIERGIDIFFEHNLVPEGQKIEITGTPYKQ